MKNSSHRQPIGRFPAAAGWSCHYGMFNRRNGVSEGLFSSCNVARDVGDTVAAVAENRRRVKQAMGVASLLTVSQVHGTGIIRLTDSPAGDVHGGPADAMVTDVPDVGLMIQQADCQAVLLYDPVRRVIGAVHCGWRGSVQRILGRVIEYMQENYGSLPADMYGMISPSLGPCCGEFVNYKTELPPEFRDFMVRDNYFDFWRISRYQMIGSGMAETRIQTAEVCTCCSGDFFSYRRAVKHSGGVTGRNCSVVCLKNG